MAEKFNPKDLKEYKNFLDMQEEIASRMRESSTKFLSASVEIVKRTRELKKLESEVVTLKAQEEELDKKIVEAKGEELENLRQQKAQLKANKKELEGLVRENKAMVTALKNQSGSLKNISIALSRDVWGGIKKVGGGLKKISAELKTQFINYSEQDSAIRRISVNVGILGKQQSTLRKNLYMNALITQRWGVSASELAGIYGSYVEEVGRLVPLSDSAAESLALISKGTALGADGAAQMASSMELFGLSIQGTAKYVEDVSNMSEKMGVSSGAVLKTLNQNLKKAQTLNFKDGVKGIAKMAALSTKLKMDMGEIMGFAETLYNPEEAIEAAASLQMMGGAFAQMADPLKLMYQGRNNPEKLQEDLSKAAASVFKFNKSTGEFQASAMEMQKLQEVAKATGISMETLVEAGRTGAKRNEIGKLLNPTMSDDVKDFIQTVGQFNEKSGKFEISVGNKTYDVSKLNERTAKSLMAQNKSLEDRAEEAQSSMERFRNMLESLKNIAYLFFGGLEESLRGPLEKLMGNTPGSIKAFGEKATQLGRDVGNWIAGVIPMLQTGIPKFVEAVKTVAQKIGEFFQSDTWKIIKEVGSAFLKTGQLLMQGFKWIYDTFGSSGIFATILLMRFPKILTGAFSILKGVIGNLGGGLKSLFSARGTRGNPMFVTMDGAGGPGTDFANRSRGRTRGDFSSGQLMHSGVKNIRKGNILKGGSRLLKGAGKGLLKRVPLIGALASMGLDVAEGGFSWETLGRGALSGLGGLLGGALGTLAGPAGTFAGGVGGSMAGDWLADKIFGESGGSKAAKPSSKSVGNVSGNVMGDGTVNPKGNVIRTAKGEIWHTSPKDYIFATQPGKGGGGMGGNMKLDVSGTIRIDGISDNILDKMTPAEKNQLARIVISRMKNQNQ